jgi:hypothetical protein
VGTGADEDSQVGPEWRTGHGEKWGLRWSRAAGGGLGAAHAYLDLGRVRTLELIADATANQTPAGWRAVMTTGEQAWWDAQPSSARGGMLDAAKAARAGGYYP